MKKIISLLIVTVLLLSCQIPVFASDSDSSYSTDVQNNTISNELNKISDKTDRDKIQQLLFTPIYGTFTQGDYTPADETASFIDEIQTLSQFSGKELDRQIAALLKDTINSKMKDPSVYFSNDAESLVKQYCPEVLNKIKSKTVNIDVQTEQAMPRASSSYAWQTYYDTATYEWRNFGNWIIYAISLTIDWGTDGKGEIAYCGVADRSYVELQGMTDFRKWCSGDYIKTYTYSAKIYQEAYFMRVNGAPAYPAITVIAKNTGKLSATGNDVP